MEETKVVEKYFPGTKTLRERYETRGGCKHGTYEWFYESGEIRVRTEYDEDEKYGTDEEFYESGGIRTRAEYVEGKIYGPCEWFYKSGEIMSRTEYVEGEKHGTYEVFYRSGGIMSRTEYDGDERHGPRKVYNPKGDLVLDIIFEDGIQINIKDYLNVVNLDKIIDFLDKLPTEKFDFSLVRSECGSTACVVGWFPSIFPEVEYTSPYFRLNGMDDLTYGDVASYILNVSEAIVFELFSPRGEINELFPTLPVCGDDATPKEVSARLKAFKEIVMGA